MRPSFSILSLVPVSVPYRGATFLNSGTGPDRKLGMLFPSPIGELHFSIVIDGSHRMLAAGFRPLSGSYISQ